MIRAGAPALRASSRRFVSRKGARWLSANVISIPAVAPVTRQTLPRIVSSISTLTPRLTRRAPSRAVPMHDLHPERGQAHGDVLRAFGPRGAVPDPLAAADDDALALAHVEHAVA